MLCSMFLKGSPAYTTVILALVVLLVMQAHMALSKPYGIVAPAYRPQQENCQNSVSVETTCQRCAKMTKSTVVYPMCCVNLEAARTFCESYLKFGRHR